MGALDGLVRSTVGINRGLTKVVEGVSGTHWYLGWRSDARFREGGKWGLIGVVDPLTRRVTIFNHDKQEEDNA